MLFMNEVEGMPMTPHEEHLNTVYCPIHNRCRNVFNIIKHLKCSSGNPEPTFKGILIIYSPALLDASLSPCSSRRSVSNECMTPYVFIIPNITPLQRNALTITNHARIPPSGGSLPCISRQHGASICTSVGELLPMKIHIEANYTHVCKYVHVIPIRFYNT
ncbi:hypothetical protein FF38_10328 [Lucilia cuprina]|uniref:Uncharacterized protein n=1 Tax=Lucilia cuprina TaxID=7375 RepID=A0A0L0C0T8_LUCCU|nr:hypothetical protein FF38_10328 [Lucilia cuprina]